MSFTIISPSAVQGHLENLADNPRRIIVNDKVVLIVRVFLVAERRKTSREFAGLGFRHIGRVYLTADISGII